MSLNGFESYIKGEGTKILGLIEYYQIAKSAWEDGFIQGLSKDPNQRTCTVHRKLTGWIYSCGGPSKEPQRYCGNCGGFLEYK